MLTTDEMEFMRETAEMAMPDRVRITRPMNPATLDASTGVLEPAEAWVVYDGHGRVRPPTSAQVEVLFGDRQIVKVRYVATLPADSGPYLVGDVVRVIESSDGFADVPLRVVAVMVGSWNAARRLALEAVE